MKHKIITLPPTLYPIKRPRTAKAISRAVSEVVKKMRPPSFCYCGENCALNRKHRALMKMGGE